MTVQQVNLDTLIDEWIKEKQRTGSGSSKTMTAYHETIHQFRDYLLQIGLDLSADLATVAHHAGTWASLSSPQAKRPGDVSASTYNQRLAILSSFYAYCQKQAKIVNIKLDNPIAHIEKRKVQAYASAMPLDADSLSDLLACIDTTPVQGKRDYALVLVALTTGRRANELVTLQLRHILQSGKHLILNFEHCKGAKQMRDRLEPEIASALTGYLEAVYGKQWRHQTGDLPLWVSFSRQNKGKAISYHTLQDVCERYLCTTKTHTLRHTFGAEMEKSGAPISEIAARLGHSNEKTTSIYLKQIRSDENPYAKKLVTRLGI